MKKKTTIILIILSFIIGSVVGSHGTGLFMKRYVSRAATVSIATDILFMHRALCIADSGNLQETQEFLEKALDSAFYRVEIESAFSGCKSAEESVQKARLYLKARNENKTKPNK